MYTGTCEALDQIIDAQAGLGLHSLCSRIMLTFPLQQALDREFIVCVHLFCISITELMDSDCMALDKALFLTNGYGYCSYFSLKTYAVGTH